MQLADLATLIRSKNAGPFFLTFDIMFSDEETYRLVAESRLLSEAAFAELYQCPASSVRVFECESALAIKFSIPRPIPQGDLGDGDLHGGQQFAPLMAIEIPVPEGQTIHPRS
jgi:Domain of unknown function (DUF4387)